MLLMDAMLEQAQAIFCQEGLRPRAGPKRRVSGRGLSLPSPVPSPHHGADDLGPELPHARRAAMDTQLPAPPAKRPRGDKAWHGPACCPPKSLRNPGETSGQSWGQPSPRPACLLLPNDPTLRDDVARTPGPPRARQQQTQVEAAAKPAPEASQTQRCSPAHARVCTHTCAQTHMHTCMWVLTYAYTCMCAKHMHTCMYTRVCRHVRAQSYVHTYMCVHVCTCVCTKHMCTCMHTSMHTHRSAWAVHRH